MLNLLLTKLISDVDLLECLEMPFTKRILIKRLLIWVVLRQIELDSFLAQRMHLLR